MTQSQTNNPRKMKVLEELGVVVTARIPCIVEAQEHSMGYIATKQVRNLTSTRLIVHRTPDVTPVQTLLSNLTMIKQCAIVEKHCFWYLVVSETRSVWSLPQSLARLVVQIKGMHAFIYK